MIPEAGVLPDSMRYYFEYDTFISEHLFTISHAGIYHCDNRYHFSREYLDVCLLIAIDAGTLTVQYQDITYTAASGSIILIDCRKPHRYFCSEDDLRMRWFHFSGNASFSYVNMLLDYYGGCAIATPTIQAHKYLDYIFVQLMSDAKNGHIISGILHQLFACLSSSSSERAMSQIEQFVYAAAAYIEKNYDDDLTIPSLAKRFSISESYLIRKFKEFIGTTPHQYLNTIRLRAAKELLTTTSLSIEQISEKCGFCNPSHLILAFRKTLHMTPLQFRTIWKK